jgi:hypothetical protein
MNARFAVLAAALSLAFVPASASAWAPAGTAPVHPGVQTYTSSGQCTANFVFQDTSGTAPATYLGHAAHCSSEGSATDTNGCDTRANGAGTPVEIDGSDGSTYHGTIAYHSWETMQRVGETDPDTCDFNDLALIQLDPAAVAATNPTVPFWGGPTGGTGTAAAGDDTYSYGNSSLRLGITALSPKRGTTLEAYGNGWQYQVYTVTPGIPGDSGSGFLNATGHALGTLSTVQLAPFPASNGVADLGKELAYAAAHGGPAVAVADGTEPFNPPF